ncbi:hypothetical protein NITLEN_10127 [Nitrospira lenta]|uniref:Uncharacterized protein n=1 Tax=Nitrospira lenta TaxID=1436998 RepID=A0A330KZT8_9BACT|nr:hypothetical protein NITLEN_10127 [Nitrospira lenta]
MNPGIGSVLYGHGGSVQSFHLQLDFCDIEKRRLARLGVQDRADFAQAQKCASKFFAFGQFRRVRGGELVVFGSNIAEVSLQRLMHGTRLTIPPWAVVGRG